MPPRPQLKQHKRVAVDRVVLDRYVGRYGIDANLVLTVRHEGDHLSLQENDEPKQELLPESDADFYFAASDDSLTFQKNAQ